LKPHSVETPDLEMHSGRQCNGSTREYGHRLRGVEAGRGQTCPAIREGEV
jgi:hypothetical protein